MNLTADRIGPTAHVLLERAIEAGGVTQVIELACGLSPRGWRFANRYGERLRSIEADLSERPLHLRTFIWEAL